MHHAGVAAAVLIAVAADAAAQETRAIVPVLGEQGDVQTDLGDGTGSYSFGRYHALLIGIEKYRDPKIPNLATAVDDVRALGELLIDRYNFARDNVTYLIDEEATRDNLLRKLDSYRGLGARDNLLIYFAGHGWVGWNGEKGEDAFWITYVPPGQPNGWWRWISLREVLRATSRIHVKHLLTISDSCYAGAIFGGATRSTAFDTVVIPAEVRRLHDRPSSWILTSGGVEPVNDDGKDGHSLFAYWLLHELRTNPAPFLKAYNLYGYVTDRVAGDTRFRLQLPIMSLHPDSPHSNPGHFVFVQANGDAAKVARARQRHPAWQDCPGFEPPSTDAVVPRLEDGKWHYYSLEGGTEVEMVLVRPGRYRREDGGQIEVVEHPFLIDRHEVTNERIRRWIDDPETEAMPPMRNDMRSHARRKSQDGVALGAREPASGYTLDEARRFLRWAGKWLPTEREWELAAGYRGESLPLQRFPWGDERETIGLEARDDHPLPVDDEALRGDVSPFGVRGLGSGVRELCDLTRHAARGEPGVVRGGTQMLAREFRRAGLRLEIARREDLASHEGRGDTGFRGVIRLTPLRGWDRR